MIKRGDIYFIRDTRQSIGSEQKADRPAVIVSNDANNKHSGVYEVVYMTTQPKTDLPTHFITSSALRTSTVLCEQISSVYEERIGEWIGTYRKCYKCGCITNNVEAIKCECGGFLYLISQIYMPKTAKEQQKKEGEQ